MPIVHRHDDLRKCGAKTVVKGQTTTFVDGKLWAVKDDPNDHEQGELIPSGTTVFIEGKLIIVHKPDTAKPDRRCPGGGQAHCQPDTAAGSPTTYAYDG